MIIVKLMGGLGNQLFQYALAKHIAVCRNTELKVDISLFKTYKLHNYSLEPFNLEQKFANRNEIASLTLDNYSYTRRAINRLFNKPPIPASTYIKEKHFHFDAEILSLPDNVYLEGYWQSEKYFLGIRDIIHNDFTIVKQPSKKNYELGNTIKSCEAISIHIRRGSYLLSEHITSHGVCPLDYYHRCVERLTIQVNNPHFYIFSDDPEWTKENLQLSFPVTYVSHNDAENDFEDLRLMSFCKHHIIANSTFSWWSAWLSSNSGKIVCAPRQWFGKERQSTRNMNDLLPPNWIVL